MMLQLGQNIRKSNQGRIVISGVKLQLTEA